MQQNILRISCTLYQGSIVCEPTDTIDDLISRLPLEVRENLTPRCGLYIEELQELGVKCYWAEGQTKIGYIDKNYVSTLIADSDKLHYTRKTPYQPKLSPLKSVIPSPLFQLESNAEGKAVQQELVNILNTKLPMLNDNDLKSLAGKITPEAVLALKTLTLAFRNFSQNTNKNT